MNRDTDTVAVIGLGYVGLPLAVEFSKVVDVVGFDTNPSRVKKLKAFNDETLEVSSEEIEKSNNLTFTNDLEGIKHANFYIITVPTPIDEQNQPNLEPLAEASRSVGSILKKGDFVIYESTVYPGVTEDVCAPILSSSSNLLLNVDYFLGYSPERINPGDKTRSLKDIIKITSGSTPDAAKIIDSFYKQIISAGTHLASSIKVAEAAKVIENTQRDINIGLINELAIIFNKMGIDTHEVLEAAGTKWNFLPFTPGLVGGHCIGIDPYYLTYKAQSIGYEPHLILAARKLNDNMAKYVSLELLKVFSKKNIAIKNSNVLIMGLTFKENCPDIRNTKVLDIITELKGADINVSVYDPWISHEDGLRDSINIIDKPLKTNYDALILAVSHKQFLEMDAMDFKKLLKKKGIIYDLKNIIDKKHSDLRL